MSPRRVAAAFGLLVALAPAELRGQLPPDHLVILAEAAGPVRTTLQWVDLATGQVTALGRFPSDGLPPRAIAWDPIADELVVGLVDGVGTRVVRLRVQGLAIRSEVHLQTLGDVVTDLQFDDGGRLYASTDGPSGGLFELGRRSNARRTIAPWPRVTSLEVPWGRTGIGLQNHPTNDPALAFVDLETGVFVGGPHFLPNLAGVTLTGAVDLPTGAIRQLVADTQGRLHLFEFLSMTTTLPIQPPLPAGATRELIGRGGTTLVLGGASSPFVRAIPLFQWTALQVLAGPLADDPVDMTLVDSAGPRVLPFGDACGPGTFYWRDQPVLGSTLFALGLQGAVPNAAAVLVLGATERAWAGSPLPIELVPGCRLWVAGDAFVSTATNASGGASIGFPIPHQPAFVNQAVYAQWFQASLGGLANSGALLVRIGP